MKLGLDLDGVFVNFIKAFNRKALEMYPGCMPNENIVPKEWYFEDIMGTGQITAIFDALKQQENFWLTPEPYTEARNAIQQTDWTKHSLYFITARFEVPGLPVTTQTRYWVEDNLGLNPREFSILAVKEDSQDRYAKYKVVKSLGLQYSIDDKASTVFGMNKLPNHYSYLLDRPYNRRAAKHYLLEDVTVKSVAEFFEKIKLT